MYDPSVPELHGFLRKRSLCLSACKWERYLGDNRYLVDDCCMIETLDSGLSGQEGSGWVRGGFRDPFGFHFDWEQLWELQGELRRM